MDAGVRRGQLVEIRERLAEIDAQPDALSYHQLRTRLASEALELMALLAVNSDQEATLN